MLVLRLIGILVLISIPLGGAAPCQQTGQRGLEGRGRKGFRKASQILNGVRG